MSCAKNILLKGERNITKCLSCGQNVLLSLIYSPIKLFYEVLFGIYINFKITLSAYVYN